MDFIIHTIFKNNFYNSMNVLSSISSGINTILAIIFGLIGVSIVVSIVAHIIDNIEAIISVVLIIFRIVLILSLIIGLFSIISTMVIPMFKKELSQISKREIVTFLEALVLFDVTWSVGSFINWIPFGKTWWITPRFPLLITVIIMLIQRISIKKTFYCEKCHKNLKHGELKFRCATCNEEFKLKPMGISGRIYLKCPNKDCTGKFLYTTDMGGHFPARFSRLNPYGKRNLDKINFSCRNCGEALENGYVVNFSLYSGSVELAKNYREDFFYYAFGPKKKTSGLSIAMEDKYFMNNLKKHYENNTMEVSDKNLMIKLVTKNSNINEIKFNMRFAVCENNEYPLLSSEGIVLILDGKEDAILRRSVVDNFIVDIERLRSQEQIIDTPLLVGICVNGVSGMEETVQRYTDAVSMERACRDFLIQKNNADIIQILCSKLKNVHFFFYRTGTAGNNSEDKVFNVVVPVQSLFLSVTRDMCNVWPPVDISRKIEIYGQNQQ